MVLCLRVKAQTGFVVTGIVTDEKKLPVAGATVFLAGTRMMVASDSKGNFSLGNLSGGDYKLVVKVVGYKPLIKEIAVRKLGMQLTLQLDPDIRSLKSVTVHPDKTWLDHVESFKQQFLGESGNATQCKIVNSGILNFEYDKKAGKLTARADDLLIILNQELGYRLKYVLLGFEFDENRNSVAFQGYPSFEELRGTPEQEAEWRANRRKAFLGSTQHFIRCVYDQNCKAEGYVVYKIRNRTPFGFPETQKGPVRLDYNQVSFDSLLTVSDDHHKVLDFKDALYVIYAKDKEETVYTSKNYSLAGMYGNRRMPDGQISIVNLFGPVIIDEHGAFQPIARLYLEGYMGWKKIGDLVPFDYDPAE
jgi:hypothetical protein